MEEEVFRFKKFIIKQNSASVFKVNTEAVLLSAWANIENAKALLEIGSGTGLISIGLLQRLPSNAMITTIDIDKNAFDLTLENCKLNHTTQIEVIHTSLQEYSKSTAKTFDLILSNPPYFDTKIKSNKARNSYAKYTDSLDFETLITHTANLVSSQGKFAVIIPYLECENFCSIASKRGLSLARRCDIFTIPSKKPKRVMLEFTYNNHSVSCENSSLVVKDTMGNYTKDYIDLTREYYTIF